MRKLSHFLLLPLMFLPARALADRRSKMMADRRPIDLTGGTLRRTTIMFRRVRDISRLFVPRPAAEMHVIASAAKADTKSARPPSRRRRPSRSASTGTLTAAPRARPQTT